MDKNKWIEEKVKEFLKDYDPKEGLPDGYSDWDNYGTALESFLRQSLEECWDKAQEDYHELEIVTEHRSLDEVLKPEHIDIKPFLDCKPEKTLLNQSK